MNKYMLRSMTGYGFVQQSHQDFDITVEIKTLNSKSFDCRINLPEALNAWEFTIKNLLYEKLRRGKINLSINLEYSDPGYQMKAVNKSLFAAYYNDFASLAEELHADKADLLSIIARFRDVYEDAGSALSEEQWALIQKDLLDAIEACDTYRAGEGKSLKTALIEYGKNIRSLKKQIEDLKDDRLERTRSKLVNNLKELSRDLGEYDKYRLEQEMIIHAEKLDITEELVRLDNHLDYFDSLMEEDTPGRSLNFIAQELNREINTIGSKANDSTIQHKVVQMKEELDKIREQALNVL